MDLDNYQRLYQYLKTGKLPDNMDTKQMTTFKKQTTHYLIQNNILLRRNTKNPLEPLKVIKTTELETTLHNLHSNILTGHFGIEATYNRARSRYYWPNMYKVIAGYIKSCDTCQRQGAPTPHEELHPIPIGKPFDRVGIDIVGPLSITHTGNRYIVVATEYLTKWPEAKAIVDTKATTIAKFIYEEIICRHGCPKALLSDQGTPFCNELVDSLCNLMTMRHRLSSAYHPQTNGLTERFNKTLCNTLAKYVSDYGDTWDTFLNAALFAYRTNQNSTTKYTPFKLLYGREAILPMDLQGSENQSNEAMDSQLQRHIKFITEDFQNIRTNAQQNITKAQGKQKQYHDQGIKLEKFNIGDKVLLYESAKAKVHGDKFREKWTGPYYIHDINGSGAYKLRTMEDKILKRYINTDRLKKYYERPIWEPQIIIG
jgi:transposase InsO family protein